MGPFRGLRLAAAGVLMFALVGFGSTERVAAGWQALVGPGGRVTISHAGREVGVATSGLFESGWRSASGVAVSPTLAAALRKCMDSSDQNVSLCSVEALIRVGDLDTTYDLKSIFEAWSKDPKKAGAQGTVGFYLYEVQDRNALPALVELTSDPNAGVRWCATSALRSLGGKEAVSALAARLSDESSDVRYQAIMGLAAHLTRDVGISAILKIGPENWKGYALGVDMYKKDPQTPVNNWKAWWETNKGNYPSVDMMLQKAARFRAERPWAHKDAPSP